MIEKIVQTFLKSQLSVPVCQEVPENAPKSYVVIDKTGGNEDGLIPHATLAIQSVAETKFKAAELNENVKVAMRNIIELDTVSKSKLNSDYDYTDTTKKKYRYQAVYDLVYYDR